jgi:hypothetical protein
MQGVSKRVAPRLYNVMNSSSTLANNVKSSLPQLIRSSAWTRKKELIGNVKNAGRKWCKTAELVLAHDWPVDSIGRAIPYGVYEVSPNFGYVCVGDCFDTPRFAVDAIADWWCEHGCQHYHSAQRLLILADAGGSNLQQRVRQTSGAAKLLRKRVKAAGAKARRT